ncbi:uncharacterized protein N7459_009475 [Penicillium hispanicum]|uniref:uncharacterized protein n=1 Tax=Penicillium hispanicum TaxID=1080232 RepID=UPI0025419AB1|nr:uncharacterized protein N7459_009475 [Penicillium hispanicum]KAJ5570045.1 hypothetical protein N7459_009475 [Penicillium hispanicum]
MAPSPPGAHTSPASQRKQIPGTQVLSWHSSERQAKKPRIRRPITACEACRSAKAKCNGQHGCERCKNRGLRCTHATPPNTSGGHGNGSVRPEIVATSSPSVDQVIPVDVAPTAATPAPADQITLHSTSVDLSGDLISMASRNEGAIQHVPASHAMDHWREDSFNQALEQFDWVFPEPDIGLNVSRP